MGAKERRRYRYVIRKSCKDDCVDSGAGKIEDEICRKDCKDNCDSSSGKIEDVMCRKSCKDNRVDPGAGKIEDEMCSSISNLENRFAKQCFGKDKGVETQLYGTGASLKDSNENLLWAQKKVFSGESSINGCSVASPDFQDNLTEMSKLSVKIQHSLPSGYVTLAQLLELRQSEKGKDSHCEEALAVRCSFKNSISEQWQQSDLDKAERTEDGHQDNKGHRQRGNSGSKDRAPDKNGQKQRVHSGKNDQVQDRIEQRQERSLKTKRRLEQLQRGNSGNINIAPDKNIRKYNHSRMIGKTESKGLVNCSKTRGTYEKKEFSAFKQGNSCKNLVYPNKTKIMCESLSRIGGVSSCSTYKTEEMEELNQGQTIPGITRKSEDISRKQLQIQSHKVCERPEYCELKVNSGEKVNNIGCVWKWRVKASSEAVKVTQNDFHTC